MPEAEELAGANPGRPFPNVQPPPPQIPQQAQPRRASVSAPGRAARPRPAGFPSQGVPNQAADTGAPGAVVWRRSSHPRP